MGTELAHWCKETVQSVFFTKSINLTLAMARNEADLEILLQSMLLLDLRQEGYTYKAISSSEVTKYCEHTPECEYAMYRGSGNTKAVNTLGRLRAIFQAFCDYFKLSGVDIISIGENYIVKQEQMLSANLEIHDIIIEPELVEEKNIVLEEHENYENKEKGLSSIEKINPEVNFTSIGDSDEN